MPLIGCNWNPWLRYAGARDPLADAGRALFGASRSRRRTINDSDRLRKYLARFGLEWAGLVGREE